MMLSKKILLFLFLSLLFFACKKDEPIIRKAALQEGYLEINANNTSVSDTASASVNRYTKKIRIAAGILNVGIEITVNGIENGTYPVNNSSGSVIKYTDDNGNIYSSAQGAGWITLSEVDTIKWKLTGSFGGDLYDINTNKKLTITSGGFSAIPYYEPLAGGGNTVVSRSLSLKIDNQLYNSNYIFPMAGKGNLSIGANDVGGWFRFVFPVTWKPGTYDISQGKIDLLYQKNNKNYYAQSGQIIIESHDFLNNIISGKFNFKVVSGGETIDISEGTFSIVY